MIVLYIVLLSYSAWFGSTGAGDGGDSGVCRIASTGSAIRLSRQTNKRSIG